MTKTKLFLKDGTCIEFWHDLKTVRGVYKRCEKYASDYESPIKQINYRIAGEALKVGAK